MMKFETPKYRSSRWDQLVELRREVLRKPLGLDFSVEDLESESDCLFMCVVHQDQVVGTLQYRILDSETVKMCQVAVHPDLQGSGVGAALVKKSEEWMRSLGYTLIVLHARESAVAFYLKLGYSLVGEPFVEVGIPHRKMSRTL